MCLFDVNVNYHDYQLYMYTFLFASNMLKPCIPVYMPDVIWKFVHYLRLAFIVLYTFCAPYPDWGLSFINTNLKLDISSINLLI